MSTRHITQVVPAGAGTCAQRRARDRPQGLWLLAFRALSTDLEVGLMLPCNVAMHETDAETSRVEFLDPCVAMGVLGNQQLAPIAREAKQRLEQVVETLAGR